MTRQKKKVVHTPDEAEAQIALKDYALATSQLKETEAKIEQEVQKIREKYKKRIAGLKELRDESFESLNAYAIANKETLFSRKKSIDLNFGIIGFRTGTPKVEKKRGITWAAALSLIKNLDIGLVRTKEEPDKDKIIASRDDAEIMGKLSQIGISVVQHETFYIEPKEEHLMSS